MRKIVWRNRNKQEIHTGYAAWDEAVNALMVGNVIDDGYSGVCLRARQTPLYPDGRTPAKPGQMRDFDLRGFGCPIPSDVMAAVEAATETQGAILYRLFHRSHGATVEHGWVLTAMGGPRGWDHDDPDSFKLLGKFYTGRLSKSRLVVDAAAEYISNP